MVPMAGRPRSFDRDSALDIALDAFWRRGYEQTSVGQLTDAMGINPPSLYAAFGAKESLFVQAADRYFERFRQGVADNLAEPTARAALQALLEATARAHTDPATPPGCLVLSEPRLQDERRWLREAIAQRLRRGQHDGDLSASCDPDGLAVFFDTVIAGMSAQARDGASRPELQTTARLALNALPPPRSA